MKQTIAIKGTGLKVEVCAVEDRRGDFFVELRVYITLNGEDLLWLSPAEKLVVGEAVMVDGLEISIPIVVDVETETSKGS